MKRIRLPSLLLLATITTLLAAPLSSFADLDPPGPPWAADGLADDPPGPPGGPPERFFEEHADELGIDQATLGQIRTIVDAARTEGRTLHDRVRAERRTMRDLLNQETPEEAAVMTQADVVGDTMTALHKHRLATMLKIRALLTLEQRAALERLRQEMGPRKRPRGPARGGPR